MRLRWISRDAFHHDNMSSCNNVDPLIHPLLYSKTGVKGVYVCFLIIALKHRLWVLVRNLGSSNIYLQSMFRAKISKTMNNFHLKNTIFTAVKNRTKLHRHVVVMLFQQSREMCPGQSK